MLKVEKQKIEKKKNRKQRKIEKYDNCKLVQFKAGKIAKRQIVVDCYS